MKKSEMIERVAGRMGLGKSAAEGAVDAVFETISDALAGEEKELIAGFRTFATRSRSARTRGIRGPGKASRPPAWKAASYKVNDAPNDSVTYLQYWWMPLSLVNPALSI